MVRSRSAVQACSWAPSAEATLRFRLFRFVIYRHTVEISLRRTGMVRSRSSRLVGSWAPRKIVASHDHVAQPLFWKICPPEGDPPLAEKLKIGIWKLIYAGIAKWSNASDCKSDGSRLRRFESYSQHQKGKVKEFWFASLRSATNWYWILGTKTNSRFRKIWFEPMFFRNVVIAVGLGEESRL